ncbi:MAG: response regulator [bacterium]
MTKTAQRILLVDDEPHLLISLADYLVSERFDVVTASSGEDALRKLEETRPDLIVLDISMPGMGGLGFLRQITSGEGKPLYPVLVLTARSMLENFFDSVAVAGFLTKPCDENKLLRTIRKILATHQKQPARSSGQKLTVLLAEDEPLLAQGMTDVFVAAGYNVVNVENGPDVLDKAVTLTPDVVVMKDVLPRLNGSAVARLIDVMPSLSGLSVVLYGAKVEGVNPVVAKCVKLHLSTNHPKDLLKALQSVLY